MKEELLRAILDYVEMSGGFASVKALADHMGTSEMTIRRYLTQLEERGSVARVSAGAVRTHHIREGDSELTAALRKYEAQKRAIARFAVSLISARQTIFMDTGSTCYYAAKYLPEENNLTVITYSLDIVSALRNRRGIRVICPGGELDSTLNVFAGPHAEEVLSSFTADIALLGVGGIVPELGTQENTLVQIPLKRVMNRNSRQSYVLADSSKLGHRSYFTGTPTRELHDIVTTTEAAPAHIDRLEDVGVRVHVVPANEEA